MVKKEIGLIIWKQNLIFIYFKINFVRVQLKNGRFNYDMVFQVVMIKTVANNAASVSFFLL